MPSSAATGAVNVRFEIVQYFCHYVVSRVGDRVPVPTFLHNAKICSSIKVHDLSWVQVGMSLLQDVEEVWGGKNLAHPMARPVLLVEAALDGAES